MAGSMIIGQQSMPRLSLMTNRAVHPQVSLHSIHVASTSFDLAQIKIEFTPTFAARLNFGPGTRDIIDVGSDRISPHWKSSEHILPVIVGFGDNRLGFSIDSLGSDLAGHQQHAIGIAEYSLNRFVIAG